MLIHGETGTGKELAARLVHERSQCEGRFVALNCATVSKELVESELFGHVRGAFTGALRDYPGLFEQAHRGTLFLDEISEMPTEAQAKVLRAIQEGEVRRLGDSRVRSVDVRIVSATNRDLNSMAGEGTFRQDLLYRLNGYVVELPALRDRDRDLVSLARQFLRHTFPNKRISRDAEAVLGSYTWPGNVRELQNVIRAAAIDAGRTIGPEHLATHLGHVADISEPESSRASEILAVVDLTGSASPLEIRHETSLPRTTLRRALDGMVSAGVLQPVGNGNCVRYARVNSTDSVRLTARQKLIMRQVENSGRVTRLECAKTTGASIRTTSRDLSQLVEFGHLAPDGRTGSRAGYVLA